MPLNDLMAAVSTKVLAAANRDAALRAAAGMLACREAGEDALFHSLCERENVGSTAIGHGIAIPHGSVPGLPGPVGVFARLERPNDWDADDGLPVDLVFALLTPPGAGADHLKALARVARALRDPVLTTKLRATTDTAAIWSLLTHPVHSDAA